MIGLNFNPKVDKEKARQIVEEIRVDKMGGWVDLPLTFSQEELKRIHEVAEEIKAKSDVLICIGIGGSYLGHRAIIEALRPQSGIEILYAGNSLSQRERDYIVERLGDRDFSINVISKSGKTLEPARAFEFFKEKLAEKYGVAEAIKRIYATTDANKGMLHDEAVRDNYTRFVIPDNIGGRYSVLTAVGLLPMAVAGVDIDALISGARGGAEEIGVFLIRSRDMMQENTEVSANNDDAENDDDTRESDEKIKDNQSEENDLTEKAENSIENTRKNDKKSSQEISVPAAIKYGFMRYLLGTKGYDTEVFASFEPATAYFNEWIKQLFGESEGKNRQGVFPAAVIYSTDLHSLGQFMQDGRRDLWETIINYPTDEINAQIVKAVQIAHVQGGLPVIKLNVPTYDERGFGELIYFFEMACAVSAKLFGVNPFDQPGVEAYKQQLAFLLERAGEDKSSDIK